MSEYVKAHDRGQVNVKRLQATALTSEEYPCWILAVRLNLLTILQLSS